MTVLAAAFRADYLRENRKKRGEFKSNQSRTETVMMNERPARLTERERVVSHRDVFSPKLF